MGITVLFLRGLSLNDLQQVSLIAAIPTPFPSLHEFCSKSRGEPLLPQTGTRGSESWPTKAPAGPCMDSLHAAATTFRFCFALAGYPHLLFGNPAAALTEEKEKPHPQQRGGWSLLEAPPLKELHNVDCSTARRGRITGKEKEPLMDTLAGRGRG